MRLLADRFINNKTCNNWQGQIDYVNVNKHGGGVGTYRLLDNKFHNTCNTNSHLAIIMEL